jgi:hypothetical protein
LEFVGGVLPPVELPRFNTGGPSSASRAADGADGRDTGPDGGAESPGVICALGVPSELPVARCSLGRPGSSLLLWEPVEGGLPWSLPLDEATGELLDKGRDVSFTACDAAACSSIVPSLTIVIVEAWYTLLTWFASIRT